MGGGPKVKTSLAAIPAACPLVGQVFAGDAQKTKSSRSSTCEPGAAAILCRASPGGYPGFFLKRLVTVIRKNPVKQKKKRVSS